MIRLLALFLAASLSLAVATADGAERAEPELGVESSIMLPSDSSIRNWQADGDRGIWVQARGGRWYYGTFAGLCFEIDSALAIAVDTRGLSRLDRFSTILVRGERCPLSSFVTSAPPPSKKDKVAAKKAQAAAEN